MNRSGWLPIVHHPMTPWRMVGGGEVCKKSIQLEDCGKTMMPEPQHWHEDEKIRGLGYLGDRIIKTWRLSWVQEIKAKRKIESSSQCLR